MDAAGVLAFVRGLEATAGIDPHSLMLLRGGRVVTEGWWAPYAPDRVHLLYSLSKSFTSTALGVAVGDGLVDLDDTVLSHFPELDGQVSDPRSRGMLVRHVAAMASGHRADTVEQVLATDPDDLVRGFLQIPPDEEPGSVFAYNQPCTFSVGAIVQRETGGSLSALLTDRFPPFAAAQTGWLRDPSGRELGWSGLHATTETVAALGQLSLQDGVWDGRRILPQGWVAQATRSHIPTDLEANPDWAQGYGFQFWMARHGYRGDGAYGQYCIVLPDHDVVVAITSQTPQMQSVLDLAWTHLLPAFGTGGSVSGGALGDTTAAEAELADHLAGLSLPLPTGGPWPTGTVAGTFTAAVGNDQPGLTRVDLDRAADGGWTVHLHEDGHVLTAAVGSGEWRVTDVLAVAGVGADGAADDPAVDVVFLETPHRLTLTCRPSTGTFTARWWTTPLHGPPLRELRMPAPPTAPR